MESYWRHRTVTAKLAEGCTYEEAAAAAGVSRIAVWMWRQASPSFREAVTHAREQGKEERVYALDEDIVCA